MTPSGIEPATFRLVASTNCATACPFVVWYRFKNVLNETADFAFILYPADGSSVPPNRCYNVEGHM